MKTCIKCGETRSLDDFNKNKRAKDKRHSYCRDCCNAVGKQNYKDNKARYTKNAEKRDQDISDYINSFKTKPCLDCGGVFPPYVMDFDHLDEMTKTANVSHLRRRRRPKSVITEEIGKCEVVCSNCHRIRTHKRNIDKFGKLRYWR